MSTHYDFRKIEDNWRDKWFDNNLYKAVDFDKRPKKYILAELPYSSGKFLHMGHMMRYTVPEMYSRYLRMQGFNVLYPMGWDTFGLPAEVFAIQEGSTPRKILDDVIPHFRDSLKRIGYAIDWDREIDTTDPKYYKWTQWMFLKLYDMGLVKKKAMPAWWCKELGTLADEEVLKDENGNTVSEKKGYPVKRIQMEQWVLDLPKYADKLLEDLKGTEYTDSVKEAQSNWIGKKDGANVIFNVDGNDIEVFTTRPDTIYGVTFLAISPEHPIIEKLMDKIENKPEVKEYIDKSRNMSDLEKQTKVKTGIKLNGINAKHPFDDFSGDIPVFIADYILMSFGTGAVMGVPGHDDRDHEFAVKYKLDIIKTYDLEEKAEMPYEGEGIVVTPEKDKGKSTFDYRNIITERLLAMGKGKKASTFHVREQIFSRRRYWGEPIPFVYKEDGSIEKVPIDKLPIELPELKEILTQDNVSSILEKDEKWKTTVDSEGKPATREIETMPTWAGSNWYYVRYLDPKNDKEYADPEKIKYWLPVDKYFGDAGHTAAHLLYTRFWLKALHDNGDFPLNEPINYRMSGGMLLGADGHKMSKSRGNGVNAEETVNTYGADSARMFLASLGPYSDTYPWSNTGIKGTFRLLVNIYQMRTKVSGVSSKIDSKDNEKWLETGQLYNQTLKNLTEMFEALKLNTGVSQIFILANHLQKLDEIPRDIWAGFVKMLAPYAPFLAEELWQELNVAKYTDKYDGTDHTAVEWKNENSVHVQPWPKYEEGLTKIVSINLPVQINGKMKGTVLVAPTSTESEVTEKIMSDDKLSKHLKDESGNKLEVKKVIFVQSKIINFIIGS